MLQCIQSYSCLFNKPTSLAEYNDPLLCTCSTFMNLFCCCRRRRSPENDPLLPKHGVRSALHRPSQSQLNKITEVFGALQAGKYPSQTQLNDALRALLSSELLAHSDRSRLSETSKELLLDIRGFIQVLIQIGMEKNGQSSCILLYLRAINVSQ